MLKKNVAIIMLACVFALCLVGCESPASSASSSSSAASPSAQPSSESSTSASTSSAAVTNSSESSAATPSSSASAQIESSESKSANPDNLLDDVRKAIDGELGSGESFIDVTLDGKTIVITADLSGANVPNGFEIVDIAANRASGITDRILELDQYSDLWDYVTVDFGSVGKITCKQADAINSEYGKYFDITIDSFEQ